MAEVDYARKQVVINGSNGACAGTADTYKLQPRVSDETSPTMALVNSVEYRSDEKSSKCFRLEFKVNPSTKQKTLISKTEAKN
jgi:hypothetical protein